MFYRKANKKGFSLVELIVVIAIMAILGSVVGVTVVRYLGRSRLQAAQSDIDAVYSIINTGIPGIHLSEVTSGNNINLVVRNSSNNTINYYNSATSNANVTMPPNATYSISGSAAVTVTHVFDQVISAQLDGNPTQFLKNNMISIVYIPKAKNTQGVPLNPTGIADAYLGQGVTAIYQNDTGSPAAYASTMDSGVLLIIDCSGTSNDGANVVSKVVSIAHYMNV